MIKKIITFVAALLLLVACNNDIDDKLQGKWQLQKVETDGNVQKVDTIYYNFLNGLFQYQVFQPAKDVYLSSLGYKYTEVEDQLKLEINDKGFLPLTDWTSAVRTFTIEKSTVKELILSSDGKRYTFRKF